MGLESRTSYSTLALTLGPIFFLFIFWSSFSGTKTLNSRSWVWLHFCFQIDANCGLPAYCQSLLPLGFNLLTKLTTRFWHLSMNWHDSSFSWNQKANWETSHGSWASQWLLPYGPSLSYAIAKMQAAWRFLLQHQVQGQLQYILHWEIPFTVHLK